MQFKSLIPMVVAAALAGCAGQSPDITPSETGKTLHVDHVRVQYAPSFAPGKVDLSVAEVSRLESFVAQTELRPNDRVYIATASGDPLGAQRVDRIAKLLMRRGIGVQQVTQTEISVEPNHVLMLADRYVVSPPSCPDWSDDPATPHTNTPTSNFGCANMSNLANMIDNPRDLVMGRKLENPTGDPALAADQRYRSGLVKPLLANGGQAPQQPGASAQASAAPSGGGAPPAGQ
jgi:pilus assembly protein CpaD